MVKDNLKVFLKKIELFNELNDSELSLLIDLMEERQLKKGEYLFEENSPRENLFLVYSGKLDLLKMNPYGKQTKLRVFDENDFLGEGALMDGYPHSTSARAIEDTTLYLVHRDQFKELMASNSTISAKVLSRISRVISRRMRLASSQAVGVSAQYVSGKARPEHDLLGDREVPYEVYYGVQTLRAIDNFHITGIPISHFPQLIESLAMVKKAAAMANHDLGLLDGDIKDAIVKACEEIINGKYQTHFVVDMIQGGAGTSTNMNANEVIANRALEHLGREKGQYDYCHPNTHVNMSQSTNDAYPTALKIAFINYNKILVETLKELVASFHKKAEEFKDVIKMGRTQLQDAVPMTLGQEFEAYSVMLREEIARLDDNCNLFLELNMGGTAIGTGINADPRYAQIVINHLKDITGLPVVLAENLVEATQDTGAFVMFSSAIKRLALKLSKICNDLRLLSSGPRAGFNEINLPKMQPGSSIMPGKVNPVIPEVVNQIAFKVIGNDVTVTMAAEAGQLQLNVMEPIIAQSIFESMEMLKNGMQTLRYRCIDGITANREVCRKYVENSIGIVTALGPKLGYEVISKLAKTALDDNRSVYELVLEQKLMSKEQLDDLLSPENMVAPRILSK